MVNSGSDPVYRGFSMETMNGAWVDSKFSLGFLTGLTMLSHNPYGKRNWFSIPVQAHIGYFPQGKMKFCWEGNIGYHLVLPCKDIPSTAYGPLLDGLWCVGTGAGVKARVGSSISFIMSLGYKMQSYVRAGITSNTHLYTYLNFAQLKCVLAFY